MLITEVIAKLEAIKQEKGDLPVYMWFEQPKICGIERWLHTGISEIGSRKGNGTTYVYLKEGFCDA